jgi:hypothetical protein
MCYGQKGGRIPGILLALLILVDIFVFSEYDAVNQDLK